MPGDPREACGLALGQRDLDRHAADRPDLRRAAARQHADVGMRADQHDALRGLGERQQAVLVLEQHDRRLRVALRDLGMRGIVDRLDGGGQRMSISPVAIMPVRMRVTMSSIRACGTRPALTASASAGPK